MTTRFPLRIPFVSALALALAACATPAAQTPSRAAASGPSEAPVTIDLPAVADDAGARLACTLVRPSGAGPFPGVIVIKGTGPQDRDGNNDTEHYGIDRALAAHLAARGVASLRCDARGSGGSTGRFWDGTLATYVRDAHAMLASLRALPGIDAMRTGIVGRSEGGIVGPIVADEDPQVRAMALVGAGERSFAECVLWQEREDMRRSGATPEATDAAVKLRADALHLVEGGGPLPPSFPADIVPLVPWLRSRLAHDTRAQTRKLRHLPLLIVQGGRDLSTPPADAALLKEDLAAGHNPDAEVALFPELSHFLVRARVDEENPVGDVDPDAVDAVARFLVQSLAS